MGVKARTEELGEGEEGQREEPVEVINKSSRDEGRGCELGVLLCLVWSCFFPALSQCRMSLEERTQEIKNKDVSTAIGFENKSQWNPVVESVGRKREEKTGKSQDSSTTADDMREDFKKFQQSTKHELQLLRELLEKNQGKKEEEIARRLECRMEKLLQNDDKSFLIWEQKLKKPEKFTKSELELIRRYVEEALGVQAIPKQTFTSEGKKEEEIARLLESRMEKELKGVFEKIKNLEQDLQKSKEDTQCQLQHLSAHLEKQLVKKEEETVRALESMMEKKFDELHKRISGLGGDLQKSQSPHSISFSS